MRNLGIKLIIFSLFGLILNVHAENTELSENHTYNVSSILELSIESSINPATLNYVKAGLARAKKEKYDLILVKMTTPGGLITTTKDILHTIGGSDIPFVVWIGPEGSSATSAGAIIASGAHLLYMSEGTNIGAATPVGLGKDIDDSKQQHPVKRILKEVEKNKGDDQPIQENTAPQGSDMRAKAINDLVAYTQSLAEARGRNADLFGNMIKDASSYKAREAAEQNLIDGIINTRAELLEDLQGKSFYLKGKKHTLNLNSPKFNEYAMDLGQKILDMFADPSMAYMLFLIGAALIYLELQAPGGFIAGSLGAIFIVLAGIGFQVLPLNFGALGLIILSFILFIMEIYITSYGILSVGGLASMLFGSLFLFRTDNAYMAVSENLVYSSVGGIALFLLFILFYMIKDYKKDIPEDYYSLVGKEGEISELSDEHESIYEYKIKIDGEIWSAESATKFDIGDKCNVLDQNKEKMVLKI